MDTRDLWYMTGDWPPYISSCCHNVANHEAPCKPRGSSCSLRIKAIFGSTSGSLPDKMRLEEPQQNGSTSVTLYIYYIKYIYICIRYTAHIEENTNNKYILTHHKSQQSGTLEEAPFWLCMWKWDPCGGDTGRHSSKQVHLDWLEAAHIILR